MAVRILVTLFKFETVVQYERGPIHLSSSWIVFVLPSGLQIVYVLEELVVLKVNCRLDLLCVSLSGKVRI